MIDATSYQAAVGLAIALSGVSLTLLIIACRAPAPKITPDPTGETTDKRPDTPGASAWLVPATGGGMRLTRR